MTQSLFPWFSQPPKPSVKLQSGYNPEYGQIQIRAHFPSESLPYDTFSTSHFFPQYQDNRHYIKTFTEIHKHQAGF